MKSLVSIIKVASAGTGGSPLPTDPDPFFKSRYHFPSSAPVTLKAKTALVLATMSALDRAIIDLNTSSTWPAEPVADGEEAWAGCCVRNSSKKKSGIRGVPDQNDDNFENPLIISEKSN